MAITTTTHSGSITITPAPKPTTSTAPKPTTADAALVALLRQYGLGSLANVLVDSAKQGLSAPEAYEKLVASDAYKQRFAGNELRRKKGLNVLSEAEYLSKEADLAATMQYYKLPRGFYDQPDDFAKAISADIGRQELTQRLEARKAIIDDGAATGVLQYAKENYGFTDGDMLAFFIDPERAQSVLDKVAKASQIGAAAARAHWGAINTAEAERLAGLGLTADQAQAGYGQAAGLQELTSNLAGNDTGVDRADLTNAIFNNDAAAKARVARKQAERTAAFQAGGGYASGKEGLAGLGSANS